VWSLTVVESPVWSANDGGPDDRGRSEVEGHLWFMSRISRCRPRHDGSLWHLHTTACKLSLLLRVRSELSIDKDWIVSSAPSSILPTDAVDTERSSRLYHLLTSPVWARGNPPYPFTFSPITLSFSFFYFTVLPFLLALSIFLLYHLFPFYQNSATPFPGWMLYRWLNLALVLCVLILCYMYFSYWCMLVFLSYFIYFSLL